MQIHPSQPKRWRNEVGVLSSTLPVLLAVVFICSSPASADSLIYDPYLNIYWMKDGNVQGKSMTWDDAKKWAEDLEYGGYNDWRLPSTPDGYYKRNDGTIWDYYGYNTNPNDNKYNVTFSELGSLYYNTFKLTADKGLSTAENPLFNKLQPGYYWFGIPSKLDDIKAAWVFDFKYGTQFLNTTTSYAYAIAVRDATPAPEPSSALLFLAGLLGLCRIRHQRTR
jgi:hypothetical protein